MRFHNQKLLGSKYAPHLSYSIRQKTHYPDGILSIEGTLQKNEPVSTYGGRLRYGCPSIFILINAATSVEITGDRHLHVGCSIGFLSAV
jgi:hypothetical protein